MAEAVPLDSAWLKAHPLPVHVDDVDKNQRGRVLVIGGSRSVPGGIMLTAEAAFRAGAGKVTIATIASAVPAIGIAMPECAILAMTETQDGEIAVDTGLLERLPKFDSIVLGPCMTSVATAGALLACMLDHAPLDTMLVLDAAAIRAAPAHRHIIAHRSGRTILTPHPGELAALLGTDARPVCKDQLARLNQAASNYSATIIAKGATSFVRDDDNALSYSGGGIGLATGGSGDILSGVIASLGAQGAGALEAAAWGVWLHGEAGRRLAETMGPIGYLARELLPLIPQIMQGARQ